MANNHALNLGKLIGNLQSLETLLRFYLLKKSVSQTVNQSQKTWPYKVGEQRDGDAFTNYDTLKELIRKFNEMASANSLLAVDSGVVDVRDLLAHGRVTSLTPSEDGLMIVKFSKPLSGKVSVVAEALMTDEWFDEKIRLVREQIDRVAKATEHA